MNQQAVKYVGVFCLGFGSAIAVFTTLGEAVVRKQKEERTTAAQEIILLHRAGAVMNERIRRGEFEGKTDEELMEAFEFEKIAQGLEG